jgi:hypothetical protein
LHRVPPSATADITDATPLSFELSAVRRKKLTNAGLGCAGSLPMRCRIAPMQVASGTRCSSGPEDATDLDRLRHDPLMKVAVGRCPQSGAPIMRHVTHDWG